MRVEPSVAPSEQDGRYPRPQLVRPRWTDLGGVWEFDYDDDDRGLADGWTTGHRLTRTIVVPFPPESPASGIGETGYHRVLWYRRTITERDIEGAGHTPGRALLLHFGAVDYRADVWVNGAHLIHHEGGHTPFTVTVPEPADGFEIVVRVEDDPHDLGQPRGKQDWAEQRHVVWYDRTSGIWQPVWLESVPRTHVSHLEWHPNVGRGETELSIELSARPLPGTRLRVVVHRGAEILAEQTVTLRETRTR
ncbi:MAG: glycoside hydrolase family 2, partial [Pseudolysinimonas sp.]